MTELSENLYVGVDFGGTTITAGMVNKAGDTLAINTVSTGRDRRPDEIFDTICGVVADVSRGYTPDAVGLGVPCPAGPGTDRLDMIENIPAMEGYPLRSKAEERLGLPVVLENDANCMAYGEHRAGALRGFDHGACITLGTGIGCGIVIGGSLYRGAGNYAGEIWNIPRPDGGTIEDRVSIGGLRKLSREIIGEEVGTRALYDRFLDGNPGAALVFERFGEAVGEVVVVILSILDPQRIALGGGLSKTFDAFRGSMRNKVAETWGESGASRIVPAELSSRAAVIGAAMLAAESTNREYR